ncbi:hypothetical protein [Leuconostoc citreum]|uniref:hypothetical protein n=1 Tax=Leuconostoc citreum TaxID=33964 RepID=UPI0002466490|nr:hypothetical protein [Leuconostoc citreum]MBA5939076.1 hypothetical protein [Leuconostoc citreum]CCF25016.1 Protein of unknown function [Leuconostoc citreum LBAE C10]
MTSFFLALTFLFSGTTFITLSKRDNNKQYQIAGVLLTVAGLILLLVSMFNH